MTQAGFELRFEGPDAMERALVMAELIEAETGAKPRVERPQAVPEATRQPRDPALVLGVLSLIVAIPSTAMSLVQLREWLRSRPRRDPAQAMTGIRISIPGESEPEPVDDGEAKQAVRLLAQAIRSSHHT